MNRTVSLALEVTADAAATGAAFDDVGAGARRMADDVDAATRTTSDRISGVADAADHMDDRASKATSALGALSSGFELVGAEKYAGALQGAALATDFFSGVGEAANLILTTSIGLKIRDAVVTARQAVVTRTAAAATRVAAAGQWLMNAALAANPIGLVIIAIAALAAGIIIAYKKSETFRDRVRAVMRAASTAVEWVIDKVQWLADKLGLNRKAWERLKDTATSAAGWIRDKVKAAFEKALAPIQWVIDKVNELLDLIKKIKIPEVKMPDLNPYGGNSLPDLNPFNSNSLAPAGGPAVSVVVNVPNGWVGDETALAQIVTRALAQQGQRLGIT